MPLLLLQFTETSRFAKRASNLIGDDELARLEIFLSAFPDVGNIIRGSGGIRKTRWSSGGQGKRGGARVIYYYAVTKSRILLLDIYPKNEKSDLTSGEIAELKQILGEWRKDL